MKIRNGFVSNSSSSNFIIELNKPIEDYTLEEFMKDYELTDEHIAKKLMNKLRVNSDSIRSVYDGDVDFHISFYDDSPVEWDDKMDVIKQMEEFGLSLLREKVKTKYNFVDGKFKRYELYEHSGTPERWEEKILPKFKGTVLVKREH